MLANFCNGENVHSIPRCCNSLNLTECGEGMGDCDNDSDCKGDLRCGINNCQKEFGHIKKNWRWHDDCCTCKFSTVRS